jgi:hypothetical protein
MAFTLKLEQAKRPVSTLRILGFILVFCTLVMMIKLAIDKNRETTRASWRTAEAIIRRQNVREFMNGRHQAWRIESEVTYPVGDTTLTTVVQSGIGEYLEERTMHRWASQHPPGTTLFIRYDPEHPATAVPDTVSGMPESGPQVPEDVKGILLFMLLSLAAFTAARWFRPRQESSSGGDQ